MIVNGRKIKIGVSALHFAWNSIEEAFKTAFCEFGADVIEFSFSDEDGPGNFLSPGHLNELRDARCLFGECPGISLHAWFDIPACGAARSAEMLVKTAAFAGASGADEVIIHMGSHPDRESGLAVLKDALEPGLPSFEESGAVLCLENHYPRDYRGLNELGGVPDDFLELFSWFNSKHLGFCLDYGHSHMSSNTEDFIARLGHHLRYVHIADNNGDEDSHLEFLSGTIDWDSALSLTLAAGFTGPFTVEYPANPRSVQKFKAFLREILLRQDAGRDNI